MIKKHIILTNVPGDNQTRYLTPTALYWEGRVLGLSSGLGEPGTLNYEIVGCLAVAWFLCWAAVSRGVKSAGPTAWFLAIFPYFVLTAMLIRAVTLPGAAEGIMYYLWPDYTRLFGEDFCNMIKYTA